MSSSSSSSSVTSLAEYFHTLHPCVIDTLKARHDDKFLCADALSMVVRILHEWAHRLLESIRHRITSMRDDDVTVIDKPDAGCMPSDVAAVTDALSDVLVGDLIKHAVSEALKAANDSAHRLVFHVIDSHHCGVQLSEHARRAISAAIEYICAEILELSGAQCRNVCDAIEADNVCAALLNDRDIIASFQRLPTICTLIHIRGSKPDEWRVDRGTVEQAQAWLDRTFPIAPIAISDYQMAFPRATAAQQQINQYAWFSGEMWRHYDKLLPSNGVVHADVISWMVHRVLNVSSPRVEEPSIVSYRRRKDDSDVGTAVMAKRLAHHHIRAIAYLGSRCASLTYTSDMHLSQFKFASNKLSRLFRHRQSLIPKCGRRMGPPQPEVRYPKDGDFNQPARHFMAVELFDAHARAFPIIVEQCRGPVRIPSKDDDDDDDDDDHQRRHDDDDDDDNNNKDDDTMHGVVYDPHRARVIGYVSSGSSGQSHRGVVTVTIVSDQEAYSDCDSTRCDYVTFTQYGVSVFDQYRPHAHLPSKDGILSDGVSTSPTGAAFIASLQQVGRQICVVAQLGYNRPRCVTMWTAHHPRSLARRFAVALLETILDRAAPASTVTAVTSSSTSAAAAATVQSTSTSRNKRHVQSLDDDDHVSTAMETDAVDDSVSHAAPDQNARVSKKARHSSSSSAVASSSSSATVAVKRANVFPYLGVHTLGIIADYADLDLPFIEIDNALVGHHGLSTVLDDSESVEDAPVLIQRQWREYEPDDRRHEYGYPYRYRTSDSDGDDIVRYPYLKPVFMDQHGCVQSASYVKDHADDDDDDDDHDARRRRHRLVQSGVYASHVVDDDNDDDDES